MEDGTLAQAMTAWEAGEYLSLTRLSASIPMRPCISEIPNMMKALKIFIDHLSDDDSVEDVNASPRCASATAGHHYACLTALPQILAALKDAIRPESHPIYQYVVCLLKANVDRVLTHVALTVRDVYNIPLTASASMSRRTRVLQSLFLMWTTTMFDPSIAQASYADPRFFGLVMVPWTANNETLTVSRPDQESSPDFMTLVDDLFDECPLLALVGNILSDPAASRCLMKAWFERCKSGALYGEPVDAAALFLGCISVRLRRICRLVEEEEEDPAEATVSAYKRFDQIVHIICGLRPPAGVFDEEIGEVCRRRSEILRDIFEAAMAINRAAGRQQPPPRVPNRTAMPEDLRQWVYIPVAIFQVLRGIIKKVTVYHVSESLRCGCLRLVCEAMGAHGRAGGHEPWQHAIETSFADMLQDFVYQVVYPSTLIAMHAALRRIPKELTRAADVLRAYDSSVSRGGGPPADVGAWTQLARFVERMWAEYRAYTEGRMRVRVCDNPSHSTLDRSEEEQGELHSQRSCSGCHVALYCSVSCQEDDWHNRHRDECAVAAAARTAAMSMETNKWYRSSYRAWHLNLLCSFYGLALSEGPEKVMILRDMTGSKPTVRWYTKDEYPLTNITCARDPRGISSTAQLAAKIEELLHGSSGNKLTLPAADLVPEGANLNQNGDSETVGFVPQIRVLEGMFPWCPVGEVVILTAKLLISLSGSPGGDVKVELVSHVARTCTADLGT